MPSLHSINNTLSLLLILLGAYLISFPLIPEVTLLFSQKFTSPSTSFVYKGTLADNQHIPNDNLLPIPAKNTIVIPKIGVHSEIFSGATSDTLIKGVWFRPHSATPGTDGNVILASHRILQGFDDPRSFYHLPKLAVGDHIQIFWDKKEFVYTVEATREVASDDIRIEAPSDSEQLTLYTCTPLWTSERRFVVTAKPLIP